MKLLFNKLCFLVMVMVMAFTCVSFAATTDTTAPTISMNKSSGSTVEGGTKLLMTVEDKESKITKVSYHWDNENEVVLTNNVNRYNIVVEPISFELGKHLLSVTAMNECGEVASRLYTYYVEEEVRDETAPTITATPATGSTLMVGENIILIVEDTESKVTKVKYSWNNETEKILTPNVNKYHMTMQAFETEGTHKLIITAENEEGLQTTKNFLYYVEAEVRDETAPTITATPATGSTLMVGESVKLVVEDEECEVERVTYRWNNGIEKVLTPNTNRCNITTEVFNTVGTYNLEVIAENEEGLETTKNFVYYVKDETRDETAPKITTSITSGKSVMLGGSLRITVQDNESKITKVTYRKNGGTAKVLKPNVNRYNITEKFNKAGIYRFEITVENEAGLKITKNFTYYVYNRPSQRR